jgi:hypothetical protein
MAMATPIRKKRNFKALQLAVGDNGPASSRDAEPVPIRQAPAPLVPAATAPVERKKRPPPMIIKAPKIPSTTGAVSAVEQDGNMLTVANGAHTAPVNGSPNLRRNTYHAALSSKLANLDMNAEIKFDLKDQDLKDLHELGQGNGGSVKKVEHVPTKTIMAKKASILAPLSLFSPDSDPADRAYRCKAFSTQADFTRASNNARLSLKVHHIILWRLPGRSQHLYLYGVHGQGLTGRDLQENWPDRY